MNEARERGAMNTTLFSRVRLRVADNPPLLETGVAFNLISWREDSPKRWPHGISRVVGPRRDTPRGRAWCLFLGPHTGTVVGIAEVLTKIGYKHSDRKLRTLGPAPAIGPNANS